MTDGEIGWMAGLFEGEGCMWKDGRGNTCYMRIVMIEQDVIKKFHLLSGCGRVRLWGKQQEHHQQAYCWQTGVKKDVQKLLLLFLPYFGEKRLAEARTLLKILELNKAPSFELLIP